MAKHSRSQVEALWERVLCDSPGLPALERLLALHADPRPVLSRASGSAHWATRLTALRRLAALGDVPARRALDAERDAVLATPRGDTDHPVKIAAFIEAYQGLGDASALGPFLPYVGEAGYHIGFTLLQWMTDARWARGVPAITQALPQAPPLLREWMLRALGELGGAEILPTLTPWTKSKATATRLAAQRAVERVKARG